MFHSVVEQMYQTRVEAEDVVLGNDVIIQCQIPSYITDIVDIIDWVDSDGINYPRNRHGNFTVEIGSSIFSLHG